MPCGHYVCVVVCWEIYPRVPLLYHSCLGLGGGGRGGERIRLIFLSVAAMEYPKSHVCI